MHINYVTNAELCNIVRQNLYKIPHEIDGVICLPRGGLFIGTIIAEYFHKPMYTLDTFINGHSSLGFGKVENGIRSTSYRRYIVVDDSVNTGETFNKARLQLKDYPYDFVYVACISANNEHQFVDVVMSCVPEFRLFELNFFRSTWVYSCIFDIDGVLCVDPEYGIDLDEEKYLDHIRNAKPLIPLQYPVKALCTTRITKYLKPTEEWLASHGIQYEMLYMLSFNSIEEKINNMNQEPWKDMKSKVSNMYPDALLFVESNYDEALAIYQNTHRPVLCVGTNTLIQD